MSLPGNTTSISCKDIKYFPMSSFTIFYKDLCFFQSLLDHVDSSLALTYLSMMLHDYGFDA